MLLAAGIAAPVPSAAQEIPLEATGEPGSRESVGTRARLAAWLEDLGELGVYPRASSFASGTGLAPGVDYWRAGLAGGQLSLLGSFARSFRGDELRQLRLGRFSRSDVLDPHPSPDQPFLYLELTSRELASGRLYSDAGAASGFAASDTGLELVAGRGLGRHLTATLRVGL